MNWNRTKALQKRDYEKTEHTERISVMYYYYYYHRYAIFVLF